MANPIKAAQAIIEELEIRAPSEIDVELIAISRNVFVRDGPLAGAEARMVRLGDRALVTLSSTIRHEERRRFNIGHELGHFELHEASVLLSCTAADMNDWTDKNRKETEANRFSAELLMPEFLFRPRCVGVPGMKILKSLAKEFRTSLTSTAIKYLKTTGEPCALFFCHNRKIEWRTKNGSFDYNLRNEGEPVHGYSYADDAFEGMKIPDDGGLVPAYAWINDSRVDLDAEIKEATCYFPLYNAALTFLWINEDIGGGSWDKEKYQDEREEDECSSEWEPMTFHKSKRKR